MAKKRLQLGRPTPIPASPGKAVLDRVPNPHTDTDYVARFAAPEFTTLCPIIAEALPHKFSQPWRVPRRLHRCHRQKTFSAAQAEMAAHRRLLVSARRNADRCILANR
jgi:hypothetical protein